MNCLPKRVFFPVASSLKRVLGFYIFHSLGFKKLFFTTLIGSVSDLVDDLTSNTFGFLKTTDTISQNQIDQTTENGLILSMYSGLTAILAPKYNPTFTGEMTFPNGKNH